VVLVANGRFHLVVFGQGHSWLSGGDFLQFCLNHRLLQVEGRPKWRTVLGGSRVYVQAMLPAIQDTRLNCAVHQVTRESGGVSIRSEQGMEHFDAVVMACHAPTSLRLLDAAPDEEAVLSGFRYQMNDAFFAYR